MSWHFSRALVAAYSGANSSDGRLSALSKSMPMPAAYLSPDRMRAFLSLSRFGMTFVPLTADLGTELLTWYRQDFHATIFPAKDPKPASSASTPVSGCKHCESFAKYNPAGFSWRTPQSLLTGGWAMYSEVWPRAGTMLDGCVFRLPTPPRLSGGIAYGLLPTHTAAVARQATNGTRPNRVLSDGITLTDWVRLKIGQKSVKPSFAEWMMLWPEGWTDLGQPAKAKFQQWLDSHGRP